ncbi:MAG: hypothetical protein WBA51_13160 [Erythrobacter sp.]
MVIEKLREKVRREAEAEAAQTQEREQKRRRRRKSLGNVWGKSLGKVVPLDVVNHKVFVPAMAVWGVALGFACVMMLANWTITRLTMFAGLEVLGSFAQVAYALVAAVIGGAAAFVAAWMLRKLFIANARSKPIATVASRKMRPIDPSADLGSDSFDAPIEEMPFASASNGPDDVLSSFEGVGDPFIESETALDDDPLELDASCEVSPELGDDPEPDTSAPETAEQAAATGPFDLTPSERERLADQQPDDDTPEPAPPRALDLGEFARLPGRNAVWIEEVPVAKHAETAPVELHKAAPAAPVPAPELVPESPESMSPIESRTAIEKLRQVPPQELSLVQMVERFAAALHENQAATHAMATTGRGPAPNPPRDAALAEALKALSLFTERGFDVAAPDDVTEQPINMVSETERELRKALEKLQNLRGAA